MTPRTVDEVHFGYFTTKRADINWWKENYPEKRYKGYPCQWEGTVD